MAQNDLPVTAATGTSREPSNGADGLRDCDGRAGTPHAGEYERELAQDLAVKFGMRAFDYRRPDLAFVTIDPQSAVAAVTYLRTIRDYRHLVFLTAIDHIEDGRFDLLYMVHSYVLNHDLGVTVPIPREDAWADSVHHLWPAAATYQRELRELFGIRFPGSPRLDEDFVLEGWADQPPMRRDFDTKAYSERTYFARPGRQSQDTREHMKQQLYPSEAETW